MVDDFLEHVDNEVTDIFLEHHGIKGMKWGVRRYQNVDGTLTAEGKMRYGTGADLNNKLKPRIPDNFMTKNGYEDNKTPRVCFSTSINGCLIGLSQNIKDKTFYVYKPSKQYDTYQPTTKEVPDCKITNEVWIKEPVDITCIGKIKVGEAKDKPLRYTYGDNKSAELYDWNWKWEDKYINQESTNTGNNIYFISTSDTDALKHVENEVTDIFLEHHRIKGMKWGVRRYQNPDGTLTQAGRMRLRSANWKSDLANEQLGRDIPKSKLIAKNESNPNDEPVYKKGSTVTHVTPLDFKKLRDGQDLYVSAEEYDKLSYKTWLTLRMRSRGFGLDTPIKEVEFKLKKDLKAPSENNQRKIFDEYYKVNKRQVDSDLKDYYEKKNKSYNKNDPYDDFIKSLDKPSPSKKDFYKSMKDNGYNAILDVHDATGSWMNAKKPLIVMDAINTLGDMKVHDISDAEINESLNKYLKLNASKEQTLRNSYEKYMSKHPNSKLTFNEFNSWSRAE